MFASRIDVSKHDKAFLIIELSNVAQHMHVHLFSHSDHSVFIHYLLFDFPWWTRHPLPVMCPWTIHTKPTIVIWCHFLNWVSTHPQNGVELEIENFESKTISNDPKQLSNYVIPDL